MYCSHPYVAARKLTSTTIEKVKKHQHTLMLVACRLRMTVIVHLIGQYILTTIKSTKKHQSVSATMNALSVQLSLHTSTIVLKMIPEDP